MLRLFCLGFKAPGINFPFLCTGFFCKRTEEQKDQLSDSPFLPARLGLFTSAALLNCSLPESPGCECLNYFTFPIWLQCRVAERIVLKTAPRALRTVILHVLDARAAARLLFILFLGVPCLL